MYSLHWSIVTMEIKRPLCLFSGKRFNTLWDNKFKGIMSDKVGQSPTKSDKDQQSPTKTDKVLYHSKEYKFHQVFSIFWDN
jgi:hypothetical protein